MDKPLSQGKGGPSSRMDDGGQPLQAAEQTMSLGPMEPAVSAAFAALDASRFGRRLCEHDPSLWKSDPHQVQAISKRLGWLDSAKDFLAKVDEINGFAREIRAAQFSHVVLLGMGGSSLCPEVARETFGDQAGWPRLLVLDNTAPAAVSAIEAQIDLAHTLFLVASKSGSTTETNCFYRYFFGLMSEREGVGKAGSHFVAITDPATILVEEGRKRDFRRIFENPEDIGGRYSALSYFGLIPMALMGVGIRPLIERALRMRASCGPDVPAAANPGLSLGALLGVCEQQGRDKITFALSPSLRRFGTWVEQLVAESTGKEGRGLVPVDGEALGKPEVYGRDRVIVSISLKEEADPEAAKKLQDLEAAGNPVVRIVLEDKLGLGAEFLRWEIATAVAGAVIGVNPFDEPNVSESKRNTAELLEEWKQKGAFSEDNPVLEGDRIRIYCDPNADWLTETDRRSIDSFAATFLKLARPSDYAAFLAYCLQTEARDLQLDALRIALRDRARVATTVGYGPRYLHSTGQLHKGGPDRGVFRACPEIRRSCPYKAGTGFLPL
jgi:glucose-6-phosphate isomerase